MDKLKKLLGALSGAVCGVGFSEEIVYTSLLGVNETGILWGQESQRVGRWILERRREKESDRLYSKQHGIHNVSGRPGSLLSLTDDARGHPRLRQAVMSRIFQPGHL